MKTVSKWAIALCAVLALTLVVVGDGTPVYGEEKSLTTSAMSLSVTTGVATDITTTSATLNGNLTSMGTATSVTVSFEWVASPASDSHETSGQIMTRTGAFHFHLTNLTPGTTYYFRAKAVGDGTALGDLISFKTLKPPIVDTDQATNLTTTSARLNGCLPSLGTANSVRVSFQFDTTSFMYGHETAPEVKNTTCVFYFDLTNLIPGTTYYFRAKAVGDGDPTYGLERIFTTRALLTPPGQPSNVSPEDHATSVSVAPTLKSSIFTDLQGENHVASQWQIASVSGDYSSPVFDSDFDAIHLTNIDIPSGLLGYSTTYHWHVRYQDNRGTWSAWSMDSSFATISAPGQTPNRPANRQSIVSPKNDAGDIHGASGAPTWVWVLFGIGAVAVIGVLVYLAWFRKPAKQ